MAHILLAEDDELFARQLQIQIGRLGHATTIVGDGAHALRELSGQAFDLAVTDIVMPEQDGIGFLLAAKKMRPTMPVIVMTGYISPLNWDVSYNYLHDAQRLGADEILHKPFTFEELDTALNRCLARGAG